METEVRPSEVRDKVLKAVSNFFDHEELREETKGLGVSLIAEASSLRSLIKLHSALRQQRILDAARKHMLNGRTANTVSFMLHKQAAAVGKLSFVDVESESPCGPIRVFILHDNPTGVIEWLAPKTSRGVPIREIPMP